VIEHIKQPNDDPDDLLFRFCAGCDRRIYSAETQYVINGLRYCKRCKEDVE
jgi:hypothetical protein